MSDDPTAAISIVNAPSPIKQGGVVLPNGLLARPDGVFFDAGLQANAFLAAVNQVFLSGAYFAAIDYAVFIKALYNTGPDLPRSASGESLIRFADEIVQFSAQRRSLYKAVKISHGAAEYYFEVPHLEEPQPADAGGPVRLSFDEFVADMWSKGIRFGIDAAAVKAQIAGGKVGRVIVARRLDAAPGRDAQIVEVAPDIHRSDAPRETADGRFDLLSFKNRFPQVKKNVRLLKKVPSAPGLPGYELSGLALQPAPPKDVALRPLAGEGTEIALLRDGEFLMSALDGFVNIDSDTGQLSIGSKIISKDGVSSRTTGNLRLNAEYEEHGEVQEQRVVDGRDITIHGDVFGNIYSHGGTVLLKRNLIGGSAHNDGGDIHISGVASGSLLQTRKGEIQIERAESCVISATRVVLKHASNCEIIADEVVIDHAEGCAIAGRVLDIGSAGPRKQSEMRVFALVPDLARFDARIAALEARAAQCGQTAAKRRAAIDTISSEPDVRNYLTLAARIRRHELVLTAEQAPQFQKITASAGPALKAIGKLWYDVKEMEVLQAQQLDQAAQMALQKHALAGQSRCLVARLDGELQLRSITFNQEIGPGYDRPAKDIKALLRGPAAAHDLLFAGSSGVLDWSFDAGLRGPDEAAPQD